MKIDDIRQIRADVKINSPLVHCITNPISINQCANAVLAIGGKPIMAEHPKEVGEITRSAQALLLNLGNITDARIESIMISAETAKKLNIPIVLDAVGVACSQLRREFAKKLIERCSPTVIKGNYSEIKALCNESYSSIGVDADKELDSQSISDIAKTLSTKLGSCVLASGQTDIVCDTKKIVHINNGCAQLASITGSGCMLGALAACYLSANPGIMAVVTACGVLGISGELSADKRGIGSFMVNLMDNISTITNEQIEKHLNTEEIEIEKA